MSTQKQMIEATKSVLMNNYGPPLLAAARGEGTRLWDADGREYLDFFAGFGGGGLVGHCHPVVVEALCRQAQTLLSHGNFFTSAPQVELAQMLTERGFGGKVFFCHSGAEANEAALKLVRLAAGPGRYKIISFHNCFHGRTMGGLSLTPEPKQNGFEPMLPGNVKATYDDIESVRSCIDSETAGVFVEPVQGEGGIRLPSKAFMQDLRKLCDDKNLLLVVDEVWTGPARTGRWFGHQHYDITPDVMTLAKALGGGAPVAACIAAPKYADVLGPGTHGCTMGGNPLCTAAGAVAVRYVDEHGLVDRAAGLGRQIVQQIKGADISCVKDVRGLGLMIGIELDRPAAEVFAAAQDAGLLICYAGANVIRIAPPLTVSDDEVRQALDIIFGLLR